MTRFCDIPLRDRLTMSLAYEAVKAMRLSDLTTRVIVSGRNQEFPSLVVVTRMTAPVPSRINTGAVNNKEREI